MTDYSTKPAALPGIHLQPSAGNRWNQTSMLKAVLLGSAMLLGACETVDNAVSDVAEAGAVISESMTKSMVLPATTSNDKALSHYMAGWSDFENALNVSANAHFDAAAAADPDFTMAYMMAAWTGASTEDFVSNTGHASKTMEDKSDGEKRLVEMLQSFLNNDAAGAVNAAEGLTEIHPDSPRAWNFLAATYGNTNNTEKARAALKTAIKLDGSYLPGYTNLGNNYMLQEPKDFTKAEKYFKKAVALAPDQSNPHDLLGDAHRAQNNLKAAYADYTKAAELAPTIGAGLQQRGHVNSFLGNYDEARDDYDRAVELENARGSNAGPNFKVFRAYVNLHEGEHDAAIDELQAIADSMVGSSMAGASDTRINALQNIALIAIENGDSERAMKAMSDAKVAQAAQADRLGSDGLRDAQKAAQIYWKGMLAARMGDADKASAKAAAFEEQVESNTNPRKLERMHEILGMSAYHQGDFATAAKHLSKGNTQANMYIKYYLARSHEAAGNSDEAGRLYNELSVYNFNGPGYAMFRKDILNRAPG